MGMSKSEAFSLPPNVHRRWDNDDGILNITFCNVKRRKGFTLRTTRPYVTFVQTIRHIHPPVEESQIREGLQLLSQSGVTYHGDYLIYLAYDEDHLPTDNIFSVDPLLIDRPEFLEALNTEEIPGRLLTEHDTKIINSPDTYEVPPVEKNSIFQGRL